MNNAAGYAKAPQRFLFKLNQRPEGTRNPFKIEGDKNMIAVLKNTATREQINSLINWFEDKGLKVNESKGEFCTVL